MDADSQNRSPAEGSARTPREVRFDPGVGSCQTPLGPAHAPSPNRGCVWVELRHAGGERLDSSQWLLFGVDMTLLASPRRRPPVTRFAAIALLVPLGLLAPALAHPPTPFNPTRSPGSLSAGLQNPATPTALSGWEAPAPRCETDPVESEPTSPVTTPPAAALPGARPQEDSSRVNSPGRAGRSLAQPPTRDPASEEPGRDSVEPGDSVEAPRPTPADVTFFERKIRPVLVSECYPCHSSRFPDQLQARLLLDTPRGLRAGGDSGPVLVPGDPAASLLLDRLADPDPSRAMPPKKRLSPEVLADFREWIRRGAPDPRDGTGPEWATPDEAARRTHWAFQPPRPHPVPNVRRGDWPRDDVDRFILAALEQGGLTPVADADPRTLLRRVSLDLTGLPPTLAETDHFVAHPTPEAFLQIVDRLLASPHFGEKWARHWLDLARYAESTGKTVNFAYPQAWRYRDYVISAFNSRKPFTQFILEQLAGDLLPFDTPAQRAEQLIATGFLAIGPKTLNERSGLKFELDLVDEQIDVTTQAFLGLSVACARCHDHKFDPVAQADYYALAGIFRSTETCYGTVSFINAQRPSQLLPLPPEAQARPGVPPLTPQERRQITGQIDRLRDSISRSQEGLTQFFLFGQISLLEAQLRSYDDSGQPKLLAMGVRDRVPAPPRWDPRRPRFVRPGPAGFTNDGTRFIGDSPLFERGESDQPRDPPIPRGTVRALGGTPLTIPADQSGRLELARWIASPDNPLTARVLVNRVWLQLFGRGLVPTAGDFGLAGRPPSHPELLDHLALQFVHEGWSIPRLIRSIVQSRVYQLGSFADPASLEIDPDNTLLWRMSPRRLDAEVLRDCMLAVSGRLQTNPPTGSAVARQGEGPLGRPRGGPDPAVVANDPRDTHRSIYLPVIRDNLTEAMALFDAADPSLITADRPQTTVPSQALYLLNNPFVQLQADSAADRLLGLPAGDERITGAFRQFYGRSPSLGEIAEARQFLDALANSLPRRGAFRRSPERDLWSAFCQVLFATAEFQYRP